MHGQYAGEMHIRMYAGTACGNDVHRVLHIFMKKLKETIENNHEF